MVIQEMKNWGNWISLSLLSYNLLMLNGICFSIELLNPFWKRFLKLVCSIMDFTGFIEVWDCVFELLEDFSVSINKILVDYSIKTEKSAIKLILSAFRMERGH